MEFNVTIEEGKIKVYDIISNKKVLEWDLIKYFSGKWEDGEGLDSLIGKVNKLKEGE